SAGLSGLAFEFPCRREVHIPGGVRRVEGTRELIPSPVILSPFAVILGPSPVILSEAKNLRSSLRVNSAKHLRSLPWHLEQAIIRSSAEGAYEDVLRLHHDKQLSHALHWCDQQPGAPCLPTQAQTSPRLHPKIRPQPPRLLRELWRHPRRHPTRETN